MEMSLSARRAWIEIVAWPDYSEELLVALRKESVDRNKTFPGFLVGCINVALRKESVDRNTNFSGGAGQLIKVALRKESVDRNFHAVQIVIIVMQSLSARRAWIEICYLDNIEITEAVALRKESVDRNRACITIITICTAVALRKESVDRNYHCWCARYSRYWSLSARRAWIEISIDDLEPSRTRSLSARRAWIEMVRDITGTSEGHGRSPQGERG